MGTASAIRFCGAFKLAVVIAQLSVAIVVSGRSDKIRSCHYSRPWTTSQGKRPALRCESSGYRPPSARLCCLFFALLAWSVDVLGGGFSLFVLLAVGLPLSHSACC